MKHAYLIGLLLLTGCSTTTTVSDSVSDGYYGVKDAVRDTASGTKSAVKNTALAVKAGAVEAYDHTSNLLGAAKDGMYHNTDRLADWMRPPAPPAPPLPIAASYCYKALQDVLCYRQPMPGWEHRLLAYQGTNAAPPSAAKIIPLPQQQASAAEPVEKKLAGSTPVFDKIPSADDGKALDPNAVIDPNSPTMVDPTHEQLPNPANSPQM